MCLRHVLAQIRHLFFLPFMRHYSFQLNFTSTNYFKHTYSIMLDYNKDALLLEVFEHVTVNNILMIQRLFCLLCLLFVVYLFSYFNPICSSDGQNIFIWVHDPLVFSANQISTNNIWSLEQLEFYTHSHTHGHTHTSMHMLTHASTYICMLSHTDANTFAQEKQNLLFTV